MRSSVILPLHDSLFSPRVIPLLTELGRRSDITVHVVDLRDERTSWAAANAAATARLLDDEPRRRNDAVRESVLQTVSEQLSDVLGSTRVRSAIRSGEIAGTLSQYAREHEAELITLGVENRDPIGEEATLQFARTLVRDTGSAVFLTATTRDGTRGTFLADLDGTETARARLELALTSARIAGVRELTVQALSGRGPAPAQKVVGRSLPVPR